MSEGGHAPGYLTGQHRYRNIFIIPIILGICFKYNDNTIPHYKQGKTLMFKKSEIDKWLLSTRVKDNIEIMDEAQRYVATHLWADDYAKYYELEAFLEASHINITLRINHGADMFDCRMSISHSFSYRLGIRRKYMQLPETTFRQVFNLMLVYCHERDAYVQFQDTLFAQVHAHICSGKPIGGLVIDANKYFDKAKAKMVERRNERHRLLHFRPGCQ